MSIIELLAIAVGLSMDAFAVSVCKGLSRKKLKFADMYIVGFYFGFFQAAMPLIGYYLGIQFSKRIMSVDHWIAFILLGIIGAKMITEAFASHSPDEEENDSLGFHHMIVLALATSIDALAVGVTFACLNENIVPAVSIIGIVTFLLSAAGVRIGHSFGVRYKAKAEFAGGLILILMGVKILAEGLNII
ncbi:manganese efflux pump MntP [Anaeromicropila populeti]|uniref:Putative manganese efflux pump MntP n=1 Tax=Anaeromicropila populeti TaxID=37658 RepID=A0A1I6HLP2_9FIRM|nr:manganese efflux pump MntP family protein [Anaeromicropila populeti]SFR55393.1 Putative Mn2+ efflux pump MntP [Anaeromicropila populeti]